VRGSRKDDKKPEKTRRKKDRTQDSREKNAWNQLSKVRLGTPKRVIWASPRQKLIERTFRLNAIHLVGIGGENAIIPYRFDYDWWRVKSRERPSVLEF
jgi:hypothetical protein